MKARLLIADDHTLFNKGVKNLLSENYDIVAQVYDGGGGFRPSRRIAPMW